MASAIPVPRANSSDSKGLAKNSVGQLGSLASSIGIQAPAAGIALVPSVMAATVGRSGPLAFLIGIVAGLFVSYVYVRLTRHYVNAGANYTFAGIMLGPAVGFIVAWGWIFMGVTNAAGTISQASDYGAYALSQMGIHLFTHGAWWIALTWLVIGVLIIACSHGLRAKLAASPMFRARYSPIGTPGERSTVALVPADSPEVAAS